MARQFILELEPGVWWADCAGDPPRTTVRENAMLFSEHGYAQIALGCARKYREFKSAKIEPVERRATVAEGDPVIGYRHNPCRSCGVQVRTPGGLLCLDCICAKMDAAGLTMRDIVPAMRQQISGAADGPKTSSSTVQPESEKRARAAQDACKSHEAGRLPKSEQNRTGSVAIREPSAASDSTLTVPSRALVAKLEQENRTARLVGRLETRLALLEQHLSEIVALHISLHAAERDPMALAADVMELDEQLNAAIEAARAVTGGKS